MTSFLSCMLHQILLGSSQGGWDGRGMTVGGSIKYFGLKTWR